MRSMLVVGLVALVSVAIPSLAQAQHAAPMSAGATGHAAAPPPPSHGGTAKAAPSHASTVHHTTTSTPAGATHARANTNPFDVFGVGGIHNPPNFVGPVSPGGFLNPLAGTNGPRGRFRNGSAVILLGGGYGYGYDYSGDDSQYQGQEQSQDQPDDQQSGGQQRPQYIFVQQVPDPRGQGQQGSPDQPQPAAEREPAAPLPDVGPFTLVMRDGSQLDAVAFTRSNGHLVYITPDGGRRSVAFSDLDVDSTQRLNQERGTPIEIPLSDDPPPTKSKPKASTEIQN